MSILRPQEDKVMGVFCLSSDGEQNPSINFWIRWVKREKSKENQREYVTFGTTSAPNWNFKKYENSIKYLNKI